MYFVATGQTSLLKGNTRNYTHSVTLKDIFLPGNCRTSEKLLNRTDLEVAASIK